ncbi:BNR-4 repeat-containing protein [Echinicola shivajiensis]|uniref:BNR-4 repeat-containing protein n=1 Tax=Echinicola shivajiensis TaxID=1035916 RepID=UPI001BFCB5F1|nr:BNR-4 repeat-containing protein [Echinicola shivajiensis]
MRPLYLVLILLAIRYEVGRAQTVEITDPVVISTIGSSRATAYTDSNKIVETETSLFVLSLDYIDRKFSLLIREFDKGKKKIVTEHVLDNNVKDNHGGGAIVIDSNGTLHVVYGPHHGPFRYVKSKNPFDILSWDDFVEIGSRMTYPSLSVDKENNLYLLGRQSNPNGIWSINLFTKTVGGGWSKGIKLIEPNYFSNKSNLNRSSYIRTYKSLIIDSEGAIHVVFKMYEYLPKGMKNAFSDRKNGVSYMLGYMYSEDKGNTWKSEKENVEIPVSPDNVELIDGKDNPEIADSYLNISNLAIDSLGRPWVTYSKEYKDSTDFFVAYRNNFTWVKHEINVPNGYVFGSSGVSIIKDKAYILSNFISKERYHRDRLWGHRENRIISLSLDLKNLTVNKIFIEEEPSWLPSMIQGFNTTTHPWCIYTSGLSGDSLTKVKLHKID